MLENIHVKNLALIDEEEIDFGRGFNILSGETGAGKSIIIGSINLALGAKLSSDVIRHGADSALIELSFSLSEEEAKKISALGYDFEDDSILLQRKIQPNKSICRVNGETVSLSALKELSSILLEMYGQHDHQSLLKSSTYEKMLDEYAGDEVCDLQNELKKLRKEYARLKEELEIAELDEQSRNRQIDLLEYEINEIISASLTPSEDDVLDKKYRIMNNARRIEEAVLEAHNALGYDNDISAGIILGAALSRLKGISNYDDRVSDLVEELTQIEGLLNDFNRNLSGYIDSIQFDEEEFFEVESRLNIINSLKTKYNLDINGILELVQTKQNELSKLKNYEEYIEELNNNIKNIYEQILGLCRSISSLRTKASKSLENKLIAAMSDLNFQDVRLEITVSPDEAKIKDTGYDDIEFLISLNVGEEIKPMQSVASGGELSRIMLAIKSVFADKADVQTLIFDEIDAGISGKTAYKVAEKLKELSKNHQLICITHLPQIAAMADDHYLIEKSVIDGRSVTKIEHLSSDDSIYELARMLGGDDINNAALENAKELKLKSR